MKKITMLAIAALGFCAAQAQVTLEGTKLTDNVSFTLKGGAVSPFQHYAFFKNARGMFGAELRKQLTPNLWFRCGRWMDCEHFKLGQGSCQRMAIGSRREEQQYAWPSVCGWFRHFQPL